jgi:hypothetical protein
MNISSCSFKGIPICWRSDTGSTNPGLYDPQLTGWLRNFNGGFLVTCGLSQIGAARIDDGVGLWPSWKNLQHQLKDRTLGLVGFGAVGRLVAAKAKVFGINVVVYDPFLKQEQLPEDI